MRWERRRSDDRGVIDRRGGGGGVARAGGGLGVVGVIIFVAIQLLGGQSISIPPGFDAGVIAEEGKPLPPGQDPDKDLRDFSAFVFNDVQDMWAKSIEGYKRAELVLYSGRTSTGGCGTGSAAAGPFYCPVDQRVYLDLSFYREMKTKLGAGGDFAWAYVIGHEVGHHVQKLVGTSDEVGRLQRENSDVANALSVKLELQADCYAGVWGRSVFDQLEDGDVEEAMNAAEAVGDDRLSGGRASPDSFTHGSSAQRLEWFRKGEAKGEPADCDTFK